MHSKQRSYIKHHKLKSQLGRQTTNLLSLGQTLRFQQPG